MKLKSILLLATCISVGLTLMSLQKKPGFDLKASVTRGREVYVTYCISCHLDQGEGIEGVYPPLAKSDYMMADKNRSIRQVLYGVTGEMKVNGKIYNTEMMGVDLTDTDASDVLNYVRNSFGNKGGAVTPAEVAAQRKK
jgi:mono/diheme cytochrome c family protein